MFNIDYRQSKRMKEFRKDHLEKEPKYNEKTYIYSYLKDQTDAMVLNGIGWALCRIIPEALDRLKK